MPIAIGAGVGKGRTIAGLVMENWRRGRRKHLWLSIGSDLRLDARRDLDDAGGTDIKIHALNKLPYLPLDTPRVCPSFLASTSVLWHYIDLSNASTGGCQGGRHLPDLLLPHILFRYGALALPTAPRLVW